MNLREQKSHLKLAPSFCKTTTPRSNTTLCFDSRASGVFFFFFFFFFFFLNEINGREFILFYKKVDSTLRAFFFFFFREFSVMIKCFKKKKRKVRRLFPFFCI